MEPYGYTYIYMIKAPFTLQIMLFALVFDILLVKSNTWYNSIFFLKFILIITLINGMMHTLAFSSLATPSETYTIMIILFFFLIFARKSKERIFDGASIK